jgi:hypothetical protein
MSDRFDELLSLLGDAFCDLPMLLSALDDFRVRTQRRREYLRVESEVASMGRRARETECRSGVHRTFSFLRPSTGSLSRTNGGEVVRDFVPSPEGRGDDGDEVAAEDFQDELGRSGTK